MRHGSLNAIANATAQVVNALFSILLLSFVARFEGVSVAGDWALIIALGQFLVVGEGAVTLASLRASAASGIRFSWGPTWYLMGGLAALLSGVGAIGNEVALAISLVIFSHVVAIVAAHNVGAILGQQRYVSFGLSMAVSALVVSPIGFALIGELGIVGAGVALLLHTVISRSTVSYIARRLPTADRSQDLSEVFALTKLGILPVIGNAADMGWVRGIAGGSAAATYRAAYTLPVQMMSLLYRLHDVILPALVSSQEPGSLMLRPYGRLAAAGGFLLGVSAALGVPIVTAILGTAPPGTAWVVLLVSVAWLVNLVSHPLELALIAKGRERTVTRVAAAELMVNLVATPIGTVYYGVVGAAAASALSALSVSAPMSVIFARRIAGFRVRNLLSRGFGLAVSAFAGGYAIGCGINDAVTAWLS